MIGKWWRTRHFKKYQEKPSLEKKKKEVIQMQEPGFSWRPLQETMLGQLFPCSLWREPLWNRCLLCSLWKGPWQSKWKCPKGTVQDPTQEQFIPEGLKPMMKIYTRRGEKEEKKEAERNCCGLIAPFVIPLAKFRWK